MEKRRRWFLKVVAMIAMLAAVDCRAKKRLDYVVLSYSESSTFCLGCPKFRADFRKGGDVTLFGLSECAIPGEYHFVVPEASFLALLDRFERARFFSIPRLDPRYGGVDALVKRLGYRDENRIHEVVDGGRPVAAISDLEREFRKATHLDEYLKPSVDLYRKLLKNGWNVNTLGEDHENAITAVVLSGDLAALQFLLKHGATVSRTALGFAVLSKTTEAFELLASARKVDFAGEEGGSLLLSAASGANPRMIEALLDRGAPVNFHQPESGDTPLLLAAGHDEQPEAALLLLRRGADVNARNLRGETALFRAAVGMNTGMIDLLAEHGAEVNARDKLGRTALMVPSNICQYWDLRSLLAHGADPTIRDNRGRTALEPDYTMPADSPNCVVSREALLNGR